MSPETHAAKTKLCPTCGTRLAENAARCSVCGAEFTAEARTQKVVQGSRMPQITLSLPLALVLLLIILGIGAVAVYFGLQTTGRVTEPTAIPTATHTPTITSPPPKRWLQLKPPPPPLSRHWNTSSNPGITV